MGYQDSRRHNVSDILNIKVKDTALIMLSKSIQATCKDEYNREVELSSEIVAIA